MFTRNLVPMTQATAKTEALSQAQYDAIVRDLRAVAERQMAAYPQYRGHWDGPEWVLVRIARDVKTKMGTAFLAGDFALAFAEEVPESERPFQRRKSQMVSVFAYSFRNKIDTAVNPAHVVRITTGQAAPVPAKLSPAMKAAATRRARALAAAAN